MQDFGAGFPVELVHGSTMLDGQAKRLFYLGYFRSVDLNGSPPYQNTGITRCGQNTPGSAPPSQIHNMCFLRKLLRKKIV
jgi:hypothetical protein